MDLNTVEAVLRPVSRDELPLARPGDAWLAGGTWLYSEPQRHLRRLIDLSGLAWPDLEADDAGLTIAATCPVAMLEGFEAPPAWRAGPLIAACCRAFWASFKIQTTATVGGNLCLALPAAPMISLAVALEGTCLVWVARDDERQVAAADFILGPQSNALEAGEVLRAIHLPASALRRRATMRQMSLTPLGRSAALLIGTRDDTGAVRLAVTAATPRPVVLELGRGPDADMLRRTLDRALPLHGYYDDTHGTPEWRQQVTRDLAEEIREELAS